MYSNKTGFIAVFTDYIVINNYFYLFHTLNQQYPNIGVQISQATEFDHRKYSPAYSTTSNASGDWTIENVTSGVYNVVAEKDSFGWQCVRCMEL